MVAERTLTDEQKATLARMMDPRVLARTIAKLLINPGSRLAKERGCKIGELPMTPQQLAVLALMLIAGRITPASAKILFREIVQCSTSSLSASSRP